MLRKRMSFVGCTDYYRLLHEYRDDLLAKYHPAQTIVGPSFHVRLTLSDFLNQLDNLNARIFYEKNLEHVIIIDFDIGFVELVIDELFHSQFMTHSILVGPTIKSLHQIYRKLINFMQFDSEKSKKGSEVLRIHLFYEDNGDAYSIEISDPVFETFYPEAYPYLDVDSFMEGFIKSSSSILILYGPPGTGKTKFIKWFLLRKAKGDPVAYVADNGVIKSGNFFCEVIGGEFRYVVIEDAQDLQNVRNTSIVRLLTLSDGLVTLDTKFIIATNTSITNIDEALIRPGRCYAVQEFRPLTYDEAVSLAVKLGVTLTDERSYTLAEIYNKNNEDGGKLQRVGFLS